MMSALLFALMVSNQQTAVVDLIPEQDPEDLLSSGFVMVDETASLTLNDIQQHVAGFRRNTAGFINPGTTAGVVWIRFDVRNASDRPGTWVVSLNRALVDPGAIYLVTEHGTRTLLANDAAAFARSYAEFGTLAARFELPPRESGSLYIRYRGGNWSGLIPSITTEETLEREVTTDLLVMVALIAGVLTLILYVSVTFVLLDRQVVLLYALSQVALLAFYLHVNGVTTVYLWPGQPTAGRLVSPLTVTVAMLTIMQFARHFLHTRTQTPRTDRFLCLLMAIIAIALVLLTVTGWGDAVPRALPLYMIYGAMLVTWFTVVPLAVIAALRWNRDNWPLAVSWSLLLAFFLTMTLVWTGRLDVVPLQQHVYGVFIYAEALFMAFGIALRIRRMRQQQIQAEQQLSRSLTAQLRATERAMRLAQEREWALEDLAEKGRLILAAGHDTRQMISALRHYALALARNGDGDRASQASKALQQIAANLDEVLTTAIQGSASGGIGDRTLALEVVEPERILAPLRLIYGSLAVEKGIDFRLRSSAHEFVTDRVLVARILGNLVSNALKYTDAGTVLTTARPWRGGLRFQVLDTGHGLHPEALESLLTDDTGQVRFESGVDGHGAGLQIVKALTARIGGSFHGASTPGRGCLFELRIPPPRQLPPAQRPYPIHLLDTDQPVPQSLLTSAAALGLEVLPGSSAAKLTAERLTDAQLILVDEHFGGALQGLSLARELTQRYANVKIGVLTYDRSLEARLRAVDACGLLLYKPLTPAQLLAAVQTSPTPAGPTPASRWTYAAR